MENATLIEALQDMAFFLELREENPFKVKAFVRAASELEAREDSIEDLWKQGKLAEVPGVGKGIQAFLVEILEKGTSSELKKAAEDFPATLLELRQVRGLGPKKIKALYQELQIGSLSDLEYACNENRLQTLKGFGPKSQENVLESVRFLKSARKKVFLAKVLDKAEAFLQELQKMPGVEKASLTGEIRRRLETLSSVDFLVLCAIEVDQKDIEKRVEVLGWDIAVRIIFVESAQEWAEQLVETTASAEHLQKLPKTFYKQKAETEEEIYQKLGFACPVPELREAWATPKDWERSPQLVQEQDVRGIFHVHSQASDGAASLEQMVSAAEKAGYEYIGISEHSESAVYAHGLTPERIAEQHEEIAKLQKRFPQIKIFHGIEADIHADGSLDYTPAVLKKFDFVIASIHGQFRMSREDMTKRLCKAIQNPYTTWIGHITGRLLLGRPGYEFDWDAVLQEAHKHDVGIELNANPYRLDVDWRILPELRKHKVKTGIFPDAHSVAGLQDVRWGVYAARKGGLQATDVINTLARKEMEAWLAQRHA